MMRTVITRRDGASLEQYFIVQSRGGGPSKQVALHFGVKKIKIGPKLSAQ